MSPTADELLGRIGRGEDLESILRSTAGPVEAELWKRVAAVRSFDRTLFETVLRPDPAGSDAPPFEQIIQRSQIEAVGEPGVFRMRAAARDESLAGWWQGESGADVPEALTELSRRLVAYYQAAGNRIETLYHLVVVDRDQARELFMALYREADDRFDLAACQDVLDCLDTRTRLPLLGPELASQLDDREAYLRARAAWSADYYRTKNFLEAGGARARFEAMLDGRGAAVMELHAPGGRGKSMQLRWLIARYCLPEPRRIACARLDFDIIDPITAARSPWLVILELAAQLNPQMPGKPLSELLASYGEFSGVLRREVGLETAGLTTELDTRQVELAGVITTRFATALAENSIGRPILVVFDTLEELVLRPEASPAELITDLVRVQAVCPDLRIILSGRYPISAVLADMPVRFPRLDTFEVDGFTAGEAARYLTELRGLAAGELIDAVIEKAGGLPFKLALFADVLELDPTFTIDQVGSYEQIDLLYLMERVIKRIEDPRVRWLVRHGVIRRALTPGFLHDVLRQSLARAMSGDPDYDCPDEDPLPTSEVAGAFPVGTLTDPDDIDADELWRKLRAYASSSSWISQDDRQPDALTFHPEVRSPMLRVVKRQRAFRSLHHDAASYFENQAAVDAARWGQWTSEAIYHRFQADGSAAGRYWARQMRCAWRQGTPVARAEIAAEVLGPEYLDREQNPLPANGPVPATGSRPIISRRVVARARFELARADADRAKVAGAGSNHSWWSSARTQRNLLEADRWSGVVHPAEIALLNADILQAEGRETEAAATLRQALAGDAGRHRHQLRLAFAATLPVADHAEAQQHLELALAESRAVSDHAAAVGAQHRLAQQYADRDQVGAALAMCEEALVKAIELGLPAVPDLAVLAVELTFRHGLPFAGLLLATKHHDAGQLATRDLRRLQDKAALLAYDPLTVLGVSPEPLPPDDLESGAEQIEARGVALTLLMEGPAAAAELERAAEVWRRAGNVDRWAQSVVLCAVLHLRVSGNLSTVRSVLDQLGPVEPGTETWVRARVAGAEVLWRTGDRDAATAWLDSAIAELQQMDAPPRHIVAVCLGALTNQVAARYLGLLARSLGRVDDVRVRVALLADLERVVEMPDDAPNTWSWDALVRRSVNDSGMWGGSETHRFDTALLNLGLADIERMAGHRDGAEGLLRRVLGLFAGSGSNRSWLALRWVSTAARCGVKAPGEVFGDLLVTYSEYPMLCGALLVEMAEGLMRSGADDDAMILVTQALGKLGRSSDRLSQWMARAQLLTAQLSQRRGDTADSRLYANAAAAIFLDLGDMDGWDTATQLTTGSPRLHDAPGEPAGSTVHLRVSRTPGDRARAASSDLQAKGPGPPGRVQVEARRPKNLRWRNNPLTVASEFLPDVGLGLSTDIGEQFGDKMRAALALSDNLSSADVDPAGGGVDLGLEIVDAFLQGISWEFAVSPTSAVPLVRSLFRVLSTEKSDREEVLNVQFGLAQVMGETLLSDGLFGPATRAALVRFQDRFGVAPDGVPGRRTRARLRMALQAERGSPGRVLLAMPGLVEARRRHRGSSIAGFDMDQQYRQAGYHTVVVEEPFALERVLLGRAHPAPLVVHLAYGLRETLSGVVLDVPGGAARPQTKGSPELSEQSESYPLTAAALSRLLGSVDQLGPRPIVVLDIAQPYTQSETWRALQLRNAFAADLFQQGTTSAVLATGLAGTNQTARLYGRLIRVLSDAGSLAEASRAVRELGDPGRSDNSRTGTDTFDSAVAFAGLALFTHDPELGTASGYQS
jgi:tetratricopeptide (TPR) repeat protein